MVNAFGMVFALALAASPAPAAAAPAAEAPATTPLREVVYKVSYTRTAQVSQENYGGAMPNSESTDMSVGQAPAFSEKNNGATDTGTVTVDVMQVAGDALGIRVTERWNGSTPSATYTGNVAGDGSVNFSYSDMNECTHAILEYFGPGLLLGQSANTGVAWTRTVKGESGDVDTTYAIGAIEGAIANIHEETTLKSKSVALMDTTVKVDVKYKPSTLVPVSGRIVMRASRSGASSVTNETTIGNFQRVSDSRDSGS